MLGKFIAGDFIAIAGEMQINDGKLSRMSGRQPQLCWWSRWPPDLKFGCQKQNLVAQVDKIESCYKIFFTRSVIQTHEPPV